MSQQVVGGGHRVATAEGAHGNASSRTGGDRRAEGHPAPDADRQETGSGDGPSQVAAPSAPADATLGALDALSEALQEMSEDQRLLEQRLGELRRKRSQGRPWREILAEEEPPGTMQVVSRMLACLARASGTLRKELVDTLRREGVSIPAIARLFGVTHQRVSNLLRRPSE